MAEFREFVDPLSEDYDIKLSSNDKKTSTESNNLNLELLNLIGCFLEDEQYCDEYTIANFGITLKEYNNPSIETLKKVSEFMKNNDSKEASKAKHR